MRRILAVAALCVGLSACSGASNAATMGEVIDAYVTWRGGEAYTSMQNMVRQGTIEVSGLSGEVQIIQTRAGERRVDVDLEIVEFSEGLSADDGWIVNTSGQVETMGDVLQATGRRELALIFGTAFSGATGEVSYLGEETREGDEWSVIRIAYEDGDAHEVFIDEDTGAMEWVRVHRDTEIFWQQWSDWEMIDGVRMPKMQAELHENAGENQVFTWAGTGLNLPLPPTVFERPSTERSVQFADGAASTGWMEFDFFRNQRIFLPTTINGTPTFSVLDSGAEMTVIDTALAAEVGLEGSGSVAATGTGGTVEVQFATGVTLQVGNITMEDMTVAILDLSDIGHRLMNGQLPMILGKEIFNETIVDVDYPNARIAFHDAETWSYEGAGAELALPDLEGSRSVEMLVNGDPVVVSFDIGQGMALTLFEPYVVSANLLDGRSTTTRLGGGVGGERESTLASIEEVQFGNTVLRDVPVSMSLGAVGAFDTTREQGNLGTEIFNRFRMVIDYASDRVFLEPDAELVAAPFDHDLAGVQLQVGDGSAEVIHLMANSPAASSDLNVGDVVVAIAGVPVEADYWRTEQWCWPFGEVGRDVTLALADGREVVLTLARFY